MKTSRDPSSYEWDRKQMIIGICQLMDHEILAKGESTLQWSKIVVTNTTFWNYMFLNFYQAKIETIFRK
jgi:hypothetical protein